MVSQGVFTATGPVAMSHMARRQGIKQVDAELQVRYRLGARTPEAAGTRALLVVYTITE